MQLRFFLGVSFSPGMFYAGIINVIFVLWMMQLTGNTVYTSRHFNYTNRIFNDDGSANFILIFMAADAGRREFILRARIWKSCNQFSPSSFVAVRPRFFLCKGLLQLYGCVIVSGDFCVVSSPEINY